MVPTNSNDLAHECGPWQVAEGGRETKFTWTIRGEEGATLQLAKSSKRSERTHKRRAGVFRGRSSLTLPLTSYVRGGKSRITTRIVKDGGGDAWGKSHSMWATTLLEEEGPLKQLGREFVLELFAVIVWIWEQSAGGKERTKRVGYGVVGNYKCASAGRQAQQGEGAKLQKWRLHLLKNTDHLQRTAFPNKEYHAQVYSERKRLIGQWFFHKVFS